MDDANAQPAGKPELDMDAINAAVNATAGNDPNLQNSFDVNDISLDDVPTSDAELRQQMSKNPEMSLAGTEIDSTKSTEEAVQGPAVKLAADVATTTPQDPSIIADAPSADALPPDPVDAPVNQPAAPEAAREASFVGGDLSDEEESSADAPAEPKKEVDTDIHADPIDNPVNKPAAPEANDLPEAAPEAAPEVPAQPVEEPKDDKKDKKADKKSKGADVPFAPSNGVLPKEKSNPFKEGGFFRSNLFIVLAVVIGFVVIIGVVIALALFV